MAAATDTMPPWLRILLLGCLFLCLLFLWEAPGPALPRRLLARPPPAFSGPGRLGLPERRPASAVRAGPETTWGAPTLAGRRRTLSLIAAGWLLGRGPGGGASAEPAEGGPSAPAVTLPGTGTAAPKLSPAEIAAIVREDVVRRQFLATADLTRSIYSDSATFQDEIDTYPINQWVRGTQQLFVGEGSTVRLVGDVQATDARVEFRFDEDLMFRIPFRPVVHLTGRVVLTRDPQSGLITAYREFWDQSILEVLASVKF
eukprot:EG_transcript_18517